MRKQTSCARVETGGGGTADGGNAILVFPCSSYDRTIVYAPGMDLSDILTALVLLPAALVDDVGAGMEVGIEAGMVGIGL